MRCRQRGEHARGAGQRHHAPAACWLTQSCSRMVTKAAILLAICSLRLVYRRAARGPRILLENQARRARDGRLQLRQMATQLRHHARAELHGAEAVTAREYHEREWGGSRRSGR